MSVTCIAKYSHHASLSVYDASCAKHAGLAVQRLSQRAWLFVNPMHPSLDTKCLGLCCKRGTGMSFWFSHQVPEFYIKQALI